MRDSTLLFAALISVTIPGRKNAIPQSTSWQWPSRTAYPSHRARIAKAKILQLGVSILDKERSSLLVYPLPHPFQFSRNHGACTTFCGALMKSFHQFRKSGFDFLFP
jgi:hypothetical protein